MKIHFNKKYFILFILLFVSEILIALYILDDFIRPYFGDYLVVLLIYCFVKSFVKYNKFKIAFGCLLFAFTVEFLQYINFITIISLQDSKLASTIIGNSFSMNDLGIYFLAFISIVNVEYISDKYYSE